MARRKQQPPLTDPANVPDAFASGFAVQDWEDWVRLVGFADDIAAANGHDGGAAHSIRRKSAAIVIPRSSVPDLIEVLKQSMGDRVEQRRHS